MQLATDLSIDLETLHNVPGGIILSIGAVFFNPKTGQMGDTFYEVISVNSSRQHGLISSQGTLEWWQNQSPEARKVLDEAVDITACDLDSALGMFSNWIDINSKRDEVKVWGNGSDFDNAFLAVAYDKVGRALPWKFFNNRCFRTLKNMAREHYKLELPEFKGARHNALNDAIWQAECAVVMLQHQDSLQRAHAALEARNRAEAAVPLTERVRRAQVSAAEDVVLRSLEGKGLIMDQSTAWRDGKPPSPTEGMFRTGALKDGILTDRLYGDK